MGVLRRRLGAVVGVGIQFFPESLIFCSEDLIVCFEGSYFLEKKSATFLQLKAALFQCKITLFPVGNRIFHGPRSIQYEKFYSYPSPAPVNAYVFFSKSLIANLN